MVVQIERQNVMEIVLVIRNAIMQIGKKTKRAMIPIIGIMELTFITNGAQGNKRVVGIESIWLIENSVDKVVMVC
jgi:hypothetical protein